MLKVDMESGVRALVETGGNLPDLVGETLSAIKMVYNGIYSHDEIAAKLFQQCLISSIVDPNNPVWFRDDRPIVAQFEVAESDGGVLQ